MNETKYSKCDGLSKKSGGFEKAARSLIKTLLLFLNIILFTCGFGLIIYCWIYFYKRDSFIGVLVGSYVFVAYYLLIISGGCLIIITIIGFVGIDKNVIKILYAYVILLTVVLVMEGLSVGCAMYYRNHFVGFFRKDLYKTMTSNYHQNSNDITEAIDLMQINFKCCGSLSYRDWEKSLYFIPRMSDPLSNKVPESCCRTPSQLCGKNTHPSNIYYKGCAFKFFESISDRLGILEYIGLVCFGTEFLAIILGVVFIILLKNDLKYRRNFHDNRT